MHRQTEPAQRFLMQTSARDRLCRLLCDALIGETNSDTVLADLQRRNLFIFPLDDEHRRDRCHHQFGDLLGILSRWDTKWNPKAHLWTHKRYPPSLWSSFRPVEGSVCGFRRLRG